MSRIDPLTEEERVIQLARRKRDTAQRNNLQKYMGPVVVPPLPDWAYEGIPIPRKNVGINVTAIRIEQYERRRAHNEARKCRTYRSDDNAD